MLETYASLFSDSLLAEALFLYADGFYALMLSSSGYRRLWSLSAILAGNGIYASILACWEKVLSLLKSFSCDAQM